MSKPSGTRTVRENTGYHLKEIKRRVIRGRGNNFTEISEYLLRMPHL